MPLGIKNGRVHSRKIDYTKLRFPKVSPDHDPAYLKFVRDRLCAVVSEQCDGVTEAAHLETFGRGIKCSDYYTAPLCTWHHRQAHDVGHGYFQELHGVNLWQVAAKLIVEWMRR